MELSNVGDRVFAAERILKKRKRRVGYFFFSHDLLHSVLFTFDFSDQFIGSSRIFGKVERMEYKVSYLKISCLVHCQ